VVVGSAIVQMIGAGAKPAEVLGFVRRLAEGVHAR
jgi:tryptophan synthase alpha subunit